jgi:hypothetical protein
MECRLCLSALVKHGGWICIEENAGSIPQSPIIGCSIANKLTYNIQAELEKILKENDGISPWVFFYI